MKRNVVFISISLVIILLLGIGVSYSLWNISVSQDTINMATTKCFNVEITSQKNSISLENAYPISNEKGKKLTPFSFTITNTCDIFASYTVSLESLKDTTLSSKFINAMINNEEIKKLSDYEITDTVNTGSIESHILAKGSLGSGDSEDYTLRVWIDYDTTMEDLDNETKTFKSKIVVKAQPSSWSPVDEGYTTLHDAILANEYQSSPEVAIKKIEAKGTPDFNNPAPISVYKINESNTISSINFKLPTSKILGNENAPSINEENILPLVGTGYEFNDNTGKYNIKDAKNLDLINLDFNNTTYYSCGNDQINIYDNSKIRIYQSSTNCSRIYKITSATRVLSELRGIETYTYTIKGYLLNQNIIESDKSDKGLYKSEDDHGTSYYYRGSVTNNYVYFAGFYWRIIRVNGDGAIRLIYDSSSPNKNGYSNNKQYIALGSFNKSYNDNAYVGYMYGNIDSNNYNDTHKNLNDSYIKQILDTWFKNIIINGGFETIISDSGFCNDRNMASGKGYGKEQTTFGAYQRIYENATPSLKCPNKDNDLFTTQDSVIGNNALTYSVGLITADELMFSGLIKNTTMNKLVYTYSDDIYWTMSPIFFANSSTDAHIFTAIEGFIHNWGKVNTGYAVRPVINLKAEVKISGGIGTINDPYVVE